MQNISGKVVNHILNDEDIYVCGSVIIGDTNGGNISKLFLCYSITDKNAFCIFETCEGAVISDRIGFGVYVSTIDGIHVDLYEILTGYEKKSQLQDIDVAYKCITIRIHKLHVISSISLTAEDRSDKSQWYASLLDKYGFCVVKGRYIIDLNSCKSFFLSHAAKIYSDAENIIVDCEDRTKLYVKCTNASDRRNLLRAFAELSVMDARY